MLKKLTLLAMAVGALAALVAPAVANASEVKENGVRVKTPATITATNEEGQPVHTTNTPFGNLTCEHVHVHGELTVNDGTTVTGVGTGEKPTNEASGCAFSDGTEATITNPKVVHLESKETGTGEVTLTFTFDAGPVQCHYEGTGMFHYAIGKNTIEVTSTALTSEIELCNNEEPEVEPITFHGNFLVTTTDGTALELW